VTPAARRWIGNPKRAVAFAILGAPVAFFPRVFLLGEALLLRDLFNWFYPWRVFAARSLAAADFPLWNPLSYMGTPFLGNMQSGLLYPLNLFFWVLEFPAAMSCFIWAQCVMASWLMYRLLRCLCCGRAGSLAGAAAWAYGGWMLVHIEFPNKLGAAGWLPLILWGIVRFRHGRVARGLALGAAGVACSVLAGYPETTYMILIGAAVVWLTGLIWTAIVSLRAAPRGRLKPVALAAISLPVVTALGLTLAAIQWMPFAQAVSESDRSSGFDSSFVLRLPFDLPQLLDLALPHLYGKPGYLTFWGGYIGQYWLVHFYAGLITLILAAVAMAAAFRRRAGHTGDRNDPRPLPAEIVAACVALLVIGSALAMGRATPLAPLAAALVPGFSYVKWLPSFLLLAVFALCVLAGFGLDALVRRLKLHQPISWTLITCPALCAAVLSVMAAVALIGPAAFESLIRVIVSPVAAEPQIKYIGPNIGLVRSDILAASTLTWCLVLVLLAASRQRMTARAAGAAIALLVFADLAVASRGINVTVDPAIYRQPSEWSETLKNRLAPHYRLYVPDATLSTDKWMYGSSDVDLYRAAAGLMLFNLNLIDGLASASDGDPIRTQRTLEWHDALEGSKSESERLRLLSLAGVKVILQVGEDKRAHLIELRDAMPRAWLAGSARFVKPEEMMAALLSPVWDPYGEVLLEEEPLSAHAGAAGPAGMVQSIRYTNNSVTLEVQAERDCWLILADTWAPGWQASVDGAPGRIWQADYLFRAVRVPAGEHQVLFLYRPISLRLGLLVSALGAAVLALTIARDRRRARPSRRSN